VEFFEYLEIGLVCALVSFNGETVLRRIRLCGSATEQLRNQELSFLAQPKVSALAVLFPGKELIQFLFER